METIMMTMTIPIETIMIMTMTIKMSSMPMMKIGKRGTKSKLLDLTILCDKF